MDKWPKKYKWPVNMAKMLNLITYPNMAKL